MEWFECKTDLHEKALGFGGAQYWVKPMGGQHELWRMTSGEDGLDAEFYCTATDDDCKRLAHYDNLERVSKATIEKLRGNNG